jgi:mannose-6-phosphate isomerase-like protein (cupin superfamily)
MYRIVCTIVSTGLLLSSGIAAAQGRDGSQATVVGADQIEAVVKSPGGGDREVKIVDLGKMNLGVAVLRRAATKPGAPINAINHTQLTEVYYVVSGGGTMVSGGEVENIKPIAKDSELVTTIVGPGNQAVFKKPGFTRKLVVGDVVIIPAGVYHGFSEVPDHIEYVSVRPDIEKVLPAGYVHPAVK